jgi:hypothetical protein
MKREHSFDSFTIADATNSKRFIQPVAATADYYPGEYLNAFLVAFDHFGVDFDVVTNSK